MNSATLQAPDLLRRFVPAPHERDFIVNNICVHLETNDPTLIEAMQNAFPGPVVDRRRMAYLWKIVRDNDAPRAGSDMTLLSSGPLRTLRRGTGTIVTIDRSRREVLGFIAPDLTGDEFASGMVPIIIELSAGASPTSTEDIRPR